MSAYYWPITGAQGPTGPQGPAGPAGPAGAGGVIIGAIPRANVATGTDIYFPITFTSGLTTAAPPSFANGTFSIIPIDCTIGTFRIIICTDQDVDGDFTATIMINGVDTAIAITIPAGSAAGVYSNLDDTLDVSAGDLLTIHLSNGSETLTQAGNWSLSLS